MLVVKSPPANEGDTRDAGLIPGSERSPGKGNGKQYSCLENSMGRGAWQAIVLGTAKSQPQLSECTYTQSFIKSPWVIFILAYSGLSIQFPWSMCLFLSQI